MQYQPEIFREQFPLVKYFVCHLTYYRVLNHQYREIGLKSPFWTFTIDAHLSRAVILWCMVFGTDENPTHWKNLSGTDAEHLRESFREALFRQTQFTPLTWNKYWKEMVSFRNEYVAHHELSYSKPVPYLDRALEVAYIYDRWIREIISPDVFEEPPLEKFVAQLHTAIKPLMAKLLAKTKQYENPELL